MASKDSDGEYTGHPLFPIPMDRVVTARRRFDLIQINRILPDKKARETCSILFNGSDLRSWQQVLDMYVRRRELLPASRRLLENATIYGTFRALVFQPSCTETVYKIRHSATGNAIGSVAYSGASDRASSTSSYFAAILRGTAEGALRAELVAF